MKKILLITVGNISLSLGIAGIFLPVLPTTPFLLLSAACYVRSSKKLYLWLIHHRFLGLYIRSFIQYKAISLRAKIISLSALWIVMLSTIFFFISFLWLRALLFCIGIGVTVYLMHYRTLTEEMKNEIKKGEPGNS
ncbi:MAG: YbaN family protein [Spirochaetales bacterium]|nr:YbaN family protein [Spirochaetales bacterium]